MSCHQEEKQCIMSFKDPINQNTSDIIMLLLYAYAILTLFVPLSVKK